MLAGSLLYSAKFVVLALYYSSDLTFQRGNISQCMVPCNDHVHKELPNTTLSPIVLTIVADLCEYRRQKLTTLLLMYYKLSNQILQT